MIFHLQYVISGHLAGHFPCLGNELVSTYSLLPKKSPSHSNSKKQSVYGFDFD